MLKIDTRQTFHLGISTLIVLGITVVGLSLLCRATIRDAIDRALPYFMPSLGMEARLFASDEYQQQDVTHTYSLSMAKNGFLVLIGDSHVKHLDARLIGGGDALNVGIGGDTSLGVFARIDRMPNAINPRSIVILVGYNDMKYRDIDGVVANVKATIEMARGKWPDLHGIIISGPLPVEGGRLYTNAKLKLLGPALFALCNREPCEYFDPMPMFSNGDGLVEMFSEDGVHLNSAGYARLSYALSLTVAKGS